MKAIILAAGRGSRMKSLTSDKPKCLVELKGLPLLEMQLAAFRDSGVDDIAIVTGYKRKMLEPYGLQEFHNSNWATTQMVSSLLCASEWLDSDDCIVSYSDIFFDASVVNLLTSSDALISVTYDLNWFNLWKKRFGDPLLDAETFKIDSENNLKEIGMQPKDISSIQGQYMGLLKFRPEGWKNFSTVFSCLEDEAQRKIHMTGMLQKIIESKDIKIKAIGYDGIWGEVDSESDLYVYN